MKLARAILGVLILSLICGFEPANAAPHASGVADGPGLWMNMWNYPKSGEMDAYLDNLERHGIRNLFVQTARSNTAFIVNPEALGELIDGCHRRHIHVIAWTFAELFDWHNDAAKLIAAGTFKSAHGERLDAVAADLESNLDASKVEALAKALKSGLGADFPLMAVVFSPLNRARQAANTPWGLIGRYFDVVAPMTYWSGRYHKFDAYSYTYATIQKVRALACRPDLEVHVIGDGMHSNLWELGQFLKACHEAEATSASLYPNGRVSQDQLEAIGHYFDFFPANNRFRLAAFRELKASGAMDAPSSGDPSAAIARGEFYRLVAEKLLGGLPRAGETQVEPELKMHEYLSAAQKLNTLGLLPDLPEGTSLEEMLSLPIYHVEALKLVAAVIDMETGTKTAERANRALSKKKSHNWFMQPALAETQDQKHPLNYLDAAQIVLEASSGLGSKAAK